MFYNTRFIGNGFILKVCNKILNPERRRLTIYCLSYFLVLVETIVFRHSKDIKAEKIDLKWFYWSVLFLFILTYHGLKAINDRNRISVLFPCFATWLLKNRRFLSEIESAADKAHKNYFNLLNRSVLYYCFFLIWNETDLFKYFLKLNKAFGRNEKK